MARNVHDALFGMSHLPGKSGWWGELLSTRSKAEAVEPASLNAIQAINNSFMTFSPATEASSRGFAFILGLVFGCASLSMILSRVVLGGILSRADFWPYLAAAYGVVLLIGGAFFVWSIAAVRRTAPPPAKQMLTTCVTNEEGSVGANWGQGVTNENVDDGAIEVMSISGHVRSGDFRDLVVQVTMRDALVDGDVIVEEQLVAE